MTTFAIIGAPAAEHLGQLKEAVERVFPDRHFEIAPGQYVAVARDLNAVQVGERLGPKGQIGQFVVFVVSDHYGWHRRDLWDWLKTRATE